MKTLSTLIAGSIVAIALGSSIALADDAMKSGGAMTADSMKAECMKKADMETDAMKKKTMEDDCNKAAMSSDAASGDAMKAGDSMMAKPKK
jgi:pentapeptide MXKDX repeat protein